MNQELAAAIFNWVMARHATDKVSMENAMKGTLSGADLQRYHDVTAQEDQMRQQYETVLKQRAITLRAFNIESGDDT
jgi:hypothetical protein